MLVVLVVAIIFFKDVYKLGVSLFDALIRSLFFFLLFLLPSFVVFFFDCFSRFISFLFHFLKPFFLSVLHDEVIGGCPNDSEVGMQQDQIEDQKVENTNKERDNPHHNHLSNKIFEVPFCP